MRRAVEQHTTPAPEIAPEVHPYDGAGMVFAFAGSLSVFMRLDRPGEFFTEKECKRPASDDQAIAAFGAEPFARYRSLAKLTAENERIEAIIRGQESKPEPDSNAELKARVAKLVRAEQAKIQAAADRMITRDLDKESAPTD